MMISAGAMKATARGTPRPATSGRRDIFREPVSGGQFSC